MIDVQKDHTYCPPIEYFPIFIRDEKFYLSQLARINPCNAASHLQWTSIESSFQHLA